MIHDLRLRGGVPLPLGELMRLSYSARRFAEELHANVREYLALLNVTIVEQRGLRSIEHLDPTRHVVRLEPNTRLQSATITAPALCGATEPHAAGWAVSHEYTVEFCEECAVRLDALVRLVCEQTCRVDIAALASSDAEFEWQHGDDRVCYADTPVGRYELSAASSALGMTFGPVLAAFNGIAIGSEPSIEAARTRCHEHYNALAAGVEEARYA